MGLDDASHNEDLAGGKDPGGSEDLAEQMERIRMVGHWQNMDVLKGEEFSGRSERDAGKVGSCV